MNRPLHTGDAAASTDFRAVVAAPPSWRRTALILDHHRYAGEVFLGGGTLPWDQATQYAGFVGHVQRLLRPDTVLVDLGRLYAQMLAESPDLVRRMAAAGGPGEALDTLLSVDSVTARMYDLVRAVAREAGQPLVLQIPSPGQWLVQMHRLTWAGVPPVVTRATLATVSARVAGWLCRLAPLPVSLLLLDGTGVDPPGPDGPGAYAAVLDVAERIGWTAALRTEQGVELSTGDLRGAVIPREFWLDDAVAVPSADFLIAEIPAEAAPATVLRRLSELG